MARRQKGQSVGKTGPPATCLAGCIKSGEQLHLPHHRARPSSPSHMIFISSTNHNSNPFFSFAAVPFNTFSLLWITKLLQIQHGQGGTTQPLAACYTCPGHGRRTDVCAYPFEPFSQRLSLCRVAGRGTKGSRSSALSSAGRRSTSNIAKQRKPTGCFAC